MFARSSLFFLAFGLAGAATHALAQGFNFRASTDVFQIDGTYRDSQTALFGPVSASVLTPRLNFATAHADYGILRLSGEIRSPERADYPTTTEAFSATAFFQDTFTISSPGRMNQTGVITVAYLLSGEVGFVGNPDPVNIQAQGSVSYLSSVRVNQSEDRVLFRRYDNGSVSERDILGQVQYFQAEFQFGLPFVVGWQVDTAGQVNTRIPSFSYSHLQSTATWQGIVSVTDASGNVVPFTFASGSGTDYTHAIVPEPAAWNFLVASAAALALQRARRRWQHGEPAGAGPAAPPSVPALDALPAAAAVPSPPGGGGRRRIFLPARRVE